MSFYLFWQVLNCFLWIRLTFPFGKMSVLVTFISIDLCRIVFYMMMFWRHTVIYDVLLLITGVLKTPLQHRGPLDGKYVFPKYFYKFYTIPSVEGFFNHCIYVAVEFLLRFCPVSPYLCESVFSCMYSEFLYPLMTFHITSLYIWNKEIYFNWIYVYTFVQLLHYNSPSSDT